MIDIGWTEMLVIAVLAIVVVGPKDLPRVMRGMARAMAKMRGLAREFQAGMNELAREAELDEIKSEVESLTKVDIKGRVQSMIDPEGDFGPINVDSLSKPPKTAQPAAKPAVTSEPAPQDKAGDSAGDSDNSGDNKSDGD